MAPLTNEKRFDVLIASFTGDASGVKFAFMKTCCVSVEKIRAGTYFSLVSNLIVHEKYRGNSR